MAIATVCGHSDDLVEFEGAVGSVMSSLRPDQEPTSGPAEFDVGNRTAVFLVESGDKALRLTVAFAPDGDGEWMFGVGRAERADGTTRPLLTTMLVDCDGMSPRLEIEADQAVDVTLTDLREPALRQERTGNIELDFQSGLNALTAAYEHDVLSCITHDPGPHSAAFAAHMALTTHLMRRAERMAEHHGASYARHAVSESVRKFSVLEAELKGTHRDAPTR